MAIAHVGTNSGVLKTSTTQPLSWTRSPTSGNLLTFRCTSYSTEIGATAVTTSGGAGTFSRDAGITGGATAEYAELFSIVAPSGVTSMGMAAGPQYVTGVFDEWSGNATSSVLDTTASNFNISAGSTSGDAGTLSTGANAGLCIASLNCDNNQTGAPTATGTGWTGDQNLNDSSTGTLSTGLAYKIISGSGSQQMTWTFAATAWAACSASYNAAASAASPYPFRKSFPRFQEWDGDWAI